MNSLQRDKCIARRISRALGIVRVRRKTEDIRVLTNAERVTLWRIRANMPSKHNDYFHRIWERKK